MGYLGPVSNGPYLRYRVYGTTSDNVLSSVVRVSTTSGANISSVERLHSSTVCAPRLYHCGICVVSRIRVLSGRTFGTLLGVVRRPPTRIGFVLTAARIRGLPTAVVSHYRHFSFEHVGPRSVDTELLCVTSRRGFALSGSTTSLVTQVSSNTVESTLSLLSRYIACSSRISLDMIDRTNNVTNESCLFRLLRYVTRTSVSETVNVASRLCSHSGSVSELTSRLVFRAEGLVLVGAIPDHRRLLDYSPTRVSELGTVTRGLSASRVVTGLRVLRNLNRSLVETASGHARFRVTLIGLYHGAVPTSNTSLDSVVTHVSHLRTGVGTLTDKSVTVGTPGGRRTGPVRTIPRDGPAPTPTPTPRGSRPTIPYPR